MVEQGGQRLKSWREAVRTDAIEALDGAPPADGPVAVTITFLMPRPKNHYRGGRSSHILKPTAPSVHASRPDIDKLIRGTLDALKNAGAYRDDSQVALIHSMKVYAGGTPGAIIKVSSHVTV
jgi:Holliday junction resolvase RusA-like endonuclease